MAPKSDTSSPSRPRLSRERVLDAAMRLADEAGIESLTMRRLARKLGVEAMSLYNHVANKGELVDSIVDLVVGEIELSSGDEEWDIAIRRCAISANEAFLRHPWACSLVMTPSSAPSPRAHPPRLVYIEWLLKRLREAGFSAELAYHAYHAVDSHIIGFTLWQLGHSAAAKHFADRESMADIAATFVPELRGGGYPYLAEHAEQHMAAPSDDGAREFEFGLDLILEGLKRARESSEAHPAP